MFAKFALDLSDGPRLLRSGGKQQSQDSFLRLLIFLSWHPANLILHGKVLPFLATPRAVHRCAGALICLDLRTISRGQ